LRWGKGGGGGGEKKGKSPSAIDEKGKPLHSLVKGGRRRDNRNRLSEREEKEKVTSFARHERKSHAHTFLSKGVRKREAFQPGRKHAIRLSVR